MKAMLLTEPKKLAIVDQPEPKPGDGEVLIRVEACGICGSDVHGYDGSSGRRIPPLIMGHEAAGIIEEVSPGVSNVAVGDRVTFDSTIYCGQCAYCREGRVNLCDDRMVLGVSCDAYRRDGAFAEFVSVPSYLIYKLPDALSFEHAAMVEPVSVAAHAVARTQVVRAGTALVVGSGMIGLLVVQALRAAGWPNIIAVDLDDSRLELARRFGADQILNAGSTGVGEEIMALTEGKGVDAAFEVVGATATVQTAVTAVRKGGAVVLVGNLAPKVDLPLQAVVTRELTLYGSCAISGEYPQCIKRMAAGTIDVEPLISAVTPLEEGPQWFERLYAGEKGLMKVILKP